MGLYHGSATFVSSMIHSRKPRCLILSKKNCSHSFKLPPKGEKKSLVAYSLRPSFSEQGWSVSALISLLHHHGLYKPYFAASEVVPSSLAFCFQEQAALGKLNQA